jgi:serine/threonine-protein kinase
MSSPPRLDRYQIIEQIGKGAMGVVYLAKDPLIGRLVALKTFHLPAGMEEEQVRQARDRFLREAQSAGILSHPNIVTIHDVVEQSAEGVTFFAMEYVRGTNLKEMLRSDEPLDLPTITDIVWQVAEALQYAHSKGVVHRDIKPANILITADRRVKLTDFGIARLQASDLTMHGQLLGTPNYMAPEQVQGKDLDHRADIFSLGVVLYELLTRHKPFQGDHLTVVTHRIVNEAPTPPEEYVGRLPGELAGVLDRALAKNPDQRYQRVGELAQELKAVCDSILTQASLSDTQEIPAAQAPAQESAPPAARAAGDGAAKAGQLASALKAGAGRALGTVRSAASKAAGAARPALGRAGALLGKKGGKPSGRRLALVVGVALVATLALFWLAQRVLDPGPLPPMEDPAAEAQLAYIEPLQAGRRMLQAGDPAAAVEAFELALSHAPASRRAEVLAVRNEARRLAAAQQSNVEQVAEVESLLVSASAAIDEGRFAAAAAEARRVLEMQPEEPRAQELLTTAEAARRRTAQREQRQQAEQVAEAEPEPARPVPPRAVAAPADAPAQEPAIDPNTPATITVDFYSEQSQGVLTVYADSRQLLRESFRFVEKAGFLRTKKVPGGFVRTVQVPPGVMDLKVYVALDSTRNESLRTELTPGAVVNLRVRVNEAGDLAIRLR